jgi:hypothetical protein
MFPSQEIISGIGVSVCLGKYRIKIASRHMVYACSSHQRPRVPVTGSLNTFGSKAFGTEPYHDHVVRCPFGSTEYLAMSCGEAPTRIDVQEKLGLEQLGITKMVKPTSSTILGTLLKALSPPQSQVHALRYYQSRRDTTTGLEKWASEWNTSVALLC